ncbi:MAG TPA: DinB family protein, partial [Thermoanaerobaculia bacterium]
MSGGAPLSDPHLAALQAQAETVAPAVAALCDGLSQAQLHWRPAPASWSIAHCLDHLRAANESYFPSLRAAIEKARAAGPKPPRPYRPGLTAGFLIRAVDPASP